MTMTHNNFLSLVLVLVLVLVFSSIHLGYAAHHNFIKTNGIHFELNGKKLYVNGFNAYWMMYVSAELNTRPNVTTSFHQATLNGMNVARTWAFSDGGYRPLQSEPGLYHEDMFKGLDFVISEARKNGVYLILSLVNNWHDYGGKKQYVDWANEKGQNLTNEDDFFTDSLVRQYYKNHVKAILTRKNSITGVTYKDDPTIMAWELMNEPHCVTDLSGKTFQDWVIEMGKHVKSIDKKHLLVVGMEGFYNKTMEARQFSDPNFLAGTDFIANHQVPTIDFAAAHLYPQTWSPAMDEFVFAEKWIKNHIEDTNSMIRKPFLLTEFGQVVKIPEFNMSVRDQYFTKIFDILYDSAKAGESCAGGLYWQLVLSGMSFRDGNEVILNQDASTAKIIRSQSKRILALKSSHF